MPLECARDRYGMGKRKTLLLNDIVFSYLCNKKLKNFCNMKLKLTVTAIAAGLCLMLNAQVRYVDGDQFALIGKCNEQSTARYERLPSELKDKVRPAVWSLGRHSAGLALRFRSNTTQVSVRWMLLNNSQMDHMAGTGIRGLDLYALDGGEWRFAGVARVGKGTQNEAQILKNMTPEEREYMLYLPLYDGVTKVEIGVDENATIDRAAVDDPVRQKPLVFYGTSILQGGCASRPGMAFTNIIERRFHRECINLGFSGNGQLDLDIARLMATVDAAAYVLDFVPNCNVEQMQDSMKTFYQILRQKHPATPVLFIEQSMKSNARFDRATYNNITRKNEVFDSIYAEIRQKDKNVSLLKSANAIGRDDEATVDGTHFTDLGMMRYADVLTPLLRKMLKR